MVIINVQVKNLGPSPASSLILSFFLPTTLRGNHQPFLKVTPPQDLSCSVTNTTAKPKADTTKNEDSHLDSSKESVQGQEVKCITEYLAVDEDVTVLLQINFSSSVFSGGSNLVKILFFGRRFFQVFLMCSY